MFYTLQYSLFRYFQLELSCCKKRQKSPNQETGLGNRGSLKHTGCLDPPKILSTIDTPPGVPGVSKDVPESTKGPFIYYVITFLGFLDPPPPLRNHVFSTENNQKLAFSDPPSPPTSDYVIYEWSLKSVS